MCIIVMCHAKKYLNLEKHLSQSHDVVSESDITPCNKIDKSLVVYRFCNVT